MRRAVTAFCTLALIVLAISVSSCTKTERDDTYYTCKMGDDLQTVTKKLDAEGIRYHDMVQDSSVCLFLDNVNDELGVHFDVVQMYFDGAHSKKLGMVAYSSLRSTDSQVDFDQLRKGILDKYKSNVVRDTVNHLQCQRGSLRINAERIDPTVYPGVYLTYIDTLYSSEH